MLKLMKYEARRQVFSNSLSVGVLLVLLAAFYGFYRSGNVNKMGIMLSIMGAVTIMVLLFAPIQHWILFHIDINSRQGNMQLLLPQKAIVVLGAKVLVALLQTIVLYGLFFTIVPYCERLAADTYGFAAGYVGKVLNTVVEMMQSANATLAPIIGVWLSLLVSVLLFSNLGLFVMAVPLPVERCRGLVRFAGYIVAFALIVFVRTKVTDLLLIITNSALVGDVFEIVYLVGVNLALFFGTAKLLEKKVSI